MRSSTAITWSLSVLRPLGKVSIKKAMGKLKAPDNLSEEIKLHRFTQLNMNFDHAKLAGELPDIH